MMARSPRSNQRPDTLMQDRSPLTRRNLLATHGRTIHLGQTLPSRDFCGTAALPLKPDIGWRGWHDRKVPGADISLLFARLLPSTLLRGVTHSEDPRVPLVRGSSSPSVER